MLVLLNFSAGAQEQASRMKI